jgi:hypothetical protein
MDNFEDENDVDIDTTGFRSLNYNNLVDRYFIKYYLDEGTENEQYVFIHTNNVIMCGLGRNNKVIKTGIKEVRDMNKVLKISGKRKRKFYLILDGAHVLNDNEYIIELELNDGSVYNFAPKVRGKLIEINTNIYDKPELVNNSPEKYGYICFLLLDPKQIPKLRDRLINKNK